MKRFAVLASGNGSNLQAIIDACQRKKIKSQLAFVFSDKKDAFALTRAKKAKIPYATLDPKTFASRQDFDQAVLGLLKEHRIDFIVLAGYMRLVSADFIKAYQDKILNIHPSLLPAFKGTHGIRDAFEYGVKVTGCTVHIVVEEMDAGPILAQEPVIIKPKDTLLSLTKRMHQAEHQLYVKVLSRF